MENKLLQATSGALDPMQSDLLGQNLKTIKELYPLVLEERKEAFRYDYKDFMPKGSYEEQEKAFNARKGQSQGVGISKAQKEVISYEEFLK